LFRPAIINSLSIFPRVNFTPFPNHRVQFQSQESDGFKGDVDLEVGREDSTEQFALGSVGMVVPI
jgi:hypothetical protein